MASQAWGEQRPASSEDLQERPELAMCRKTGVRDRHRQPHGAKRDQGGERRDCMDWHDVVRRNIGSIRLAPRAIRADRRLMLELVRKDGLLLHFALGDLITDRELVLEAVRQNGSALNFAAPALQDDTGVVLEALKCDGMAYQYASRRLRDDNKVILAALSQNGRALSMLSRTLRRNADYVHIAVAKNGAALKFADSSLLSSRHIVKTAMETYPQALAMADEELRGDPAFVLEGVTKTGTVLQYACEKLKADKDFVLKAVEKDVWAFSSAAKTLRSDRGFVLECMKRNCMALEFATLDVKLDKTFHKQIFEVMDTAYLRNYVRQLRDVSMLVATSAAGTRRSTEPLVPRRMTADTSQDDSSRPVSAIPYARASLNSLEIHPSPSTKRVAVGRGGQGDIELPDDDNVPSSPTGTMMSIKKMFKGGMKKVASNRNVAFGEGRQQEIDEIPDNMAPMGTMASVSLQKLFGTVGENKGDASHALISKRNKAIAGGFVQVVGNAESLKFLGLPPEPVEGDRPQSASKLERLKNPRPSTGNLAPALPRASTPGAGATRGAAKKVAW